MITDDRRLSSPINTHNPSCTGTAFYDRFDAVILLSLSVGALLACVKARVTNPFGKDPADRKRILEDLRTVEPLLRATATIEKFIHKHS
jgi:hypothetical protein